MSAQQTIATAVIIAAGSGARRLPITRVIDKAMLPIGNRPTVDYVVEQCVLAGVKTINFVVASETSLIKAYYGDTLNIAKEFPWLRVRGSVTLHYIVQDVHICGYGTASAVRSAEEALRGTKQFIVVAADAFMQDETNDLITRLVEACDDNTVGAIAGMYVPPAEIGQYGRIEGDENGKLVAIIEKDATYAGSRLPMANIAYYVLSSDIFPIISDLDQQNGEYYLTDAIVRLSEQGGVKIVPAEGVYLDSGTLEHWVTANQHVLATERQKPTA